MEIVAWILVVVGVFYLAGLVLQFPFFYTNPKSKALIRVLGRRGFNVFLFIFGLVFLGLGLWLMP